VHEIAKGFEGVGRVKQTDLTYPAFLPCARLGARDLAIIGVPVYAGRVPEIAAHRLKEIKGAGTPAVVVAVYGNREFEDALVEMRDIAIAQGFEVVAAGAFIAEHSFSTDELPIAAGRPDSEGGGARRGSAPAGPDPRRGRYGRGRKPGVDRDDRVSRIWRAGVQHRLRRCAGLRYPDVASVGPDHVFGHL